MKQLSAQCEEKGATWGDMRSTLSPHRKYERCDTIRQSLLASLARGQDTRHKYPCLLHQISPSRRRLSMLSLGNSRTRHVVFGVYLPCWLQMMASVGPDSFFTRLTKSRSAGLEQAHPWLEIAHEKLQGLASSCFGMVVKWWREQSSEEWLRALPPSTPHGDYSFFHIIGAAACAVIRSLAGYLLRTHPCSCLNEHVVSDGRHQASEKMIR